MPSEAAPGAVGIAKAGRRQWIGMAVIALPCVLYSMDLTILNLAIPALSADLKPSGAQLLWIGDIYGFMVAGWLMTMGTLGDRIGRRRLLLIGAAAFGIASVLAALSTSAAMLIATRALLGVAGATLAPSTLALVRNMFADPRERSIAIGLWIASYSAGAAIGPLVGGALLEHFWWGSAFLVGVPVMLLLLVMGPIFLPEYRDRAAGRLDLPSAALSIAAVLLAIYGLKRVAVDGASWAASASIAAGVALAIAFLRRQATIASPMIDLALFRERRFSASLAAYTLGTFAVFGVFIYVGQFLQLVLGLRPLQAGLWTVPLAAAFIVGAMLTPWLARRIGAERLLVGGLVLAAAGFAALARIDAHSPPAWLATIIVVYSLGLAPVFTLSTDFIVGSAPPAQAGTAAALSETGSELGGALGIALLGSVGAFVYRQSMAGALPTSLSSDEASASRGTLGAALTTAHRLGGPDAEMLTNIARTSFVHGLHVAALTACAAVLAMAGVFALATRRARRSKPQRQSGSR